LPQAQSARWVVLELLVNRLDRGLEDRAVDHRRSSVGGIDTLEQVAEGRGLRSSLGLGHPGLRRGSQEALTHIGHQPLARNCGVDLPEHARLGFLAHYCHQDVAGLEVAVDDALVVGVLHCLAHRMKSSSRCLMVRRCLSQ